MHITIAAIGKRIPDWVKAGLADFSKRFPPEINLVINEIQPSKRNKNTSIEKILIEEAEKIHAVTSRHQYVIALDETGTRQTTMKLSQQMNEWMRVGRNIMFVIGGADGLDRSVISNAREVWSLSDYTLPHALVRLLLVEQLYRASSILRNHPYHRE